MQRKLPVANDLTTLIEPEEARLRDRLEIMMANLDGLDNAFIPINWEAGAF